MKTWLHNWKRKRGLDVEAELRAARPNAPENLVRSIAGLLNPRPARSRVRYGFVGALAVASVAVLGAFGGLSYAALSVSDAVDHVAGIVHFNGVLPNADQKKSSAGNQYGVAPHITKVSPTTKIVGGTTLLTVNGTNIQANGNSITVAGISVSTVKNTPSLVTAVAPSHPSGTLTGPVRIDTDFGHDSSASLTIHAVPTIGASGLSQTNLEPGLTLTITGTGYTDATKVNFVGARTVMATPTVGSDTSLTVVVPTGLSASGHVTITGPAGTSSQSTQTFTFTSTSPTVKTVAPLTGVVAGQHNAATSIDITGTNFDASDTVEFNGVAAATQTFNSTTEFHATAPAGATVGKVSVVDTVGGAGIYTKDFTPIKNPSVSSVTPSAAPASGAGAPVNGLLTIDGSNLTGVGTTVTFPGNATPQTTAAHKGSTTAVDVKVPKNATSGSLTISNAAGTDNATFVLLVAPSPVTFTDLDNTPQAIPGDTLQIDTTTAGGFNGVTSVAIGKTVIQSGDFTTFTGTQIKLTIPDGTTSNKIVVSKNFNLKGTSTATLTMAAAPTITKVPANGVALGQPNSADTLTITGANFKGVDNGASTDVVFKAGSGTVTAAATVATDGKSLTVKAPATSTAGTVTVETDAGSVTSKTTFTPIKKPASLSGAPTADGSGDFGSKIAGTITIDGSNLQSVGTKVTFPGNATAQVTTAHKGSTTAIDVKVPSGATAGSLTVSNAAGSTTLTGFVVITAAPHPTAPLTVTHGSVAHITGTGLLGITAVKVGSITVSSSSITLIDATHVDVTIPSNARLGANQKISLTNAVGTGMLTVTVN